ncbi:DUF6262 family protein [Rhodococcus sp. T7]|uniref:DUF6262 family protein n=1 Tax=Rhodococcus sp. T7 TaxID=627444 RepID=UPI0013576889|nr:DUF6262 family protein [Rhodococcus sp. T7]KAF0956877.1 hypothetical protein MLGJGCBP_09957 [Rhodococcus sp. T7]KAF0962011.1 hypothetical protein MLGJGCBP_04793 [Rhodococcus sp. T7]
MTNPMIEGRRADSIRRRQRVVKALSVAGAAGGEITVSSIARAAGVDRSFLYRHSDLLARIHTAQSCPSTASGNGEPVTRESLKADLANTHQRIARLVAHNVQLERKLSELLGEAAWRESGLGAPTDIDQLQRRITMLEQHVVDLTGQLEERSQELDAARSANRELFTNMNKQH